jgi:hypothetical protein
MLSSRIPLSGMVSMARALAVHRVSLSWGLSSSCHRFAHRIARWLCFVIAALIVDAPLFASTPTLHAGPQSGLPILFSRTVAKRRRRLLSGPRHRRTGSDSAERVDAAQCGRRAIASSGLWFIGSRIIGGTRHQPPLMAVDGSLWFGVVDCCGATSEDWVGEWPGRLYGRPGPAFWRPS